MYIYIYSILKTPFHFLGCTGLPRSTARDLCGGSCTSTCIMRIYLLGEQLKTSQNGMNYPLVIKDGNGKSPINGGFNKNIIYKWSMFRCHVWLSEGVCMVCDGQKWTTKYPLQTEVFMGPSTTNGGCFSIILFEDQKISLQYFSRFLGAFHSCNRTSLFRRNP